MNTEAPNTWSETGYVTQTPYMRDFFRYQTPIAMSYAAADNGFDAPDCTQPFRYVDLGCGEAITLLVMAASYPDAQFVGVDLNPTHIANAQAIVDATGLENLTLLNTTFDDQQIDALGPFDYVASHGVYSWVSTEVQSHLRVAAGRLLRVGGLFYMCHYVRPGAAKIEMLFAFLKSLMKDRPELDLEARARAALQQARTLIDSGAPLFARYSSFEKEISALEERDPRYLVHEFCNQYFTPGFLGDVFDDFAQEDLHHVGSTREDRNNIRNLFASDMDTALSGLTWDQAEIRASMLYFDAFRWDVFSKAASGRRPQRNGSIDPFVFDAKIYPYRFSKTHTLWQREVNFDTPLFRAVINLVNRGQKTVSEVRQDASLDTYQESSVRSLLRDMIASREFQPLEQPALRPQAEKGATFHFTHPLSAALCARDLMAEGQINFPSQIIGGALQLSRFDALATWHLDGKSIDVGSMTLARRIMGMEPDEVAALSLEKIQSKEGFIEAWRRFAQRTLPRLIKYGVMRTESQAQ